MNPCVVAHVWVSQHSLRMEVCYEFEAIQNSVPDNLNYRNLVQKKKKKPTNTKKYFSFEKKCNMYNIYR